MDSDDDDDDDLIINKAEDEEAKDADVELSAEELRRQGELAEGVRKIKVRSGAFLFVPQIILIN